MNAITNNKVTFDEDDGSVIQTVVQIDGLGRAVRTAKTGFVNGVEGWNVNGQFVFDSKGRVIKEGMTYFVGTGKDSEKSDFTNEDITFITENADNYLLNYPTEYEYDEKDRRVLITLPDDTKIVNKIKIEKGLIVSETIDQKIYNADNWTQFYLEIMGR